MGRNIPIKRKPYSKRRKTYPPKQKTCPDYFVIYDLIDAAVRDTFSCHPEYLSKGINPMAVQQSIAKRATGLLRSRDIGISKSCRRMSETTVSADQVSPVCGAESVLTDG